MNKMESFVSREENTFLVWISANSYKPHILMMHADDDQNKTIGDVNCLSKVPTSFRSLIKEGLTIKVLPQVMKDAVFVEGNREFFDRVRGRALS